MVANEIKKIGEKAKQVILCSYSWALGSYLIFLINVCMRNLFKPNFSYKQFDPKDINL